MIKSIHQFLGIVHIQLFVLTLECVWACYMENRNTTHPKTVVMQTSLKA